MKSRMRSRPRRRVLALGSLWFSLSAAVVLVPGCYGRNCDAGSEIVGTEPGQGRMVDENTWESAALDETWLWFPRQRTYVFDIRSLMGRKLKDIDTYVSSTADPRESSLVNASGNIALLLHPRANGIDVKNDTCSDYYLRLVVEAYPLPPDAPPDSSTDAGPSDAPSADAHQ